MSNTVKSVFRVKTAEMTVLNVVAVDLGEALKRAGEATKVNIISVEFICTLDIE